LVLAGVGLWATVPKVRVSTSQQGLAQLRISGLGAQLIRSVWVGARGLPVPLFLRDNQLFPSKHLSPGEVGQVTVVVHGPSWLSWLPWEHQSLNVSLLTPQVPELMSSSVTRSLSGSVTLRFSKPVRALWLIGKKSYHTVLPAPSRTVTVRLGATTPGRQGRFQVAIQPRSWEPRVTIGTVRWRTVAYLKAAARSSGPIEWNAPLTVTFSQPIRTPQWSHWKLTPDIPGRWHQVNATTFQFLPTGMALAPNELIQLTIPGGQKGPVTTAGSYLAKTTRVTWATQPGSVLRLQQLLAQQGYLPVSWTPSGSPLTTLSAQQRAVYQPPQGTFAWKYPNLPSALRQLWAPGQMNVVTKGAIMQFERANGLAVDGIAGPEVWHDLIRDQLLGRVSPYPYTYIYVTETLPETLELWVNNSLKLTTLANTGIPQMPTILGTHAIYERLPFQVMRGKNPNGVPYADPVWWINYFIGGDAVHGFVRAHYGFPQSLGCVEVPPKVAPTIYHTVHYGTLVTVEPPGALPWPAKPGAKASAASSAPSPSAQSPSTASH
jgi:peptidoglycan hydrolase-like protein with peptidoglycan-binding domain